MSNTPNIRFKGFADDWEQRKFGDVTEIKSASRVHKEEWTASGVPFFRSSDVMAAINGTENEKAYISEELYKKLSSVSGKIEKGDVLVTGGGSVGNPYIVPNNEPLYTKDADLLWVKHSDELEPFFVYEYFYSPSFRSYLGSISHVGTIAHYTITQLSNTPISLPSVAEQKKIGRYFRTLDHLINLHQRKCDEVRQLKKFMLQKMFPKSGELIPEIRFAGFTDAWEQRKLGDIADVTKLAGFEFTEHVVYSDEGTIIALRGLNVKNGQLVLEDVKYIDSSNFAKLGRSKLYKNDVLFTYVGTVGELAIIPENDRFYLAPNVSRIRFDLEFDSSFMLQQMGSKSFYDNMIFPLIATSSQPALSMENIRKFMVFVPREEKEQQKIGRYFANLDNLITLHQRKCDELKEVKRFMLQNMFV